MLKIGITEQQEVLENIISGNSIYKFINLKEILDQKLNYLIGLKK